LDEFSDVTPTPNIRVIVPPALEEDVPTYCSGVNFGVETPGISFCGATAWINEQVNGGNEWMTVYTLTLASQAYNHVLDAYPWRDHEAMKALIPHLISQVLQHVASGGIHPVIKGNVDAILPPFDAVLLPFDQSVVHLEVMSTLGGVQPTSLLHTYEVVHHIGRTQKCRAQTRQLFERLFIH
jgi:hypothetical protein